MCIIVYVCVYVYVYFVVCVFWFFLCSFVLQYFDTVGWVFWPVKTVSHITYTVLEGTLNTNQPTSSGSGNGSSSSSLLVGRSVSPSVCLFVA